MNIHFDLPAIFRDNHFIGQVLKSHPQIYLFNKYKKNTYTENKEKNIQSNDDFWWEILPRSSSITHKLRSVSGLRLRSLDVGVNKLLLELGINGSIADIACELDIFTLKTEKKNDQNFEFKLK